MARQSTCHGKRVKVEDRLRVSSLLGKNSGHRAWQHVPLPNDHRIMENGKKQCTVWYNAKNYLSVDIINE